MRTVLGIDPGPEKSGYVVLAPGDNIIARDHSWNRPLLSMCARMGADDEAAHLAIERMQYRRGQYAPARVHRTSEWVGRFLYAFGRLHEGERCTCYYPSRVKAHLCRRVYAQKKSIAEAIKARFPDVNFKAWNNHMIDALAIAVTCMDKQGEQNDGKK